MRCHRRTLFHVSPARNRDSIRARGLLLSETPSRYVWLLDCEDTARKLARLPWGGSRANDIWAVDGDGVELSPDPHPGGQEGAFAGHSHVSAQPIPADRLTLHQPA